ncbi:tripartite tricarboxylate transporter substrate binding protein [Pigmentiphaga sp. H8]|uniref:Bug family tripartite tricarboxylate transporter substrate binding protein n=1 Tax=unclassified Pigmentiphaga TaxID=2626614 RepID=UPI000F5B30C8|nr:tripartite tricarboxylate transporter substrate-binding protein [Pigmentiphaga sp. H8]AZG07297.1 tripartite tricarboxylate transporter substrate binding protein [Pigmentiphaga sp. H8]
MYPRNVFARTAGATVLALAAAGACAQGQPYPSKPITIVVAFGPGGAGDLVTRKVAQAMSARIGQPVVVENKPGAGAAAAAVAVAQARPDGYTALLTGNGTAISSVLFKSLPYSLSRDFRHVSSVASFDLALITDGHSRFKSVADVIAYAKANPGKLNIGTSRIGSTQHLAAELFKSMAGIDAVSIPYKTTGDMIAAVRAGDVQVAFEVLSPILGQLSAGSVKAIGVTSARRFPGLPDVPTVAEGGVPGFDASSWAGISVPAATPTPVVERLAREIRAAVESPEVQSSLQAMGYVASASTPAEMTARIERDAAKWKAVIETAEIPLQ